LAPVAPNFFRAEATGCGEAENTRHRSHQLD
jgi:hypothetical protein